METTELNWDSAVKHLNEVKNVYLTLPPQSTWFVLGQIRQLEARWDTNERTEALFNEIMAMA